MTKKEIKTIVQVLNSTNNGFRYPIGNKELTIKVRDLESKGLIRYEAWSGLWTDKKISYKK